MGWCSVALLGLVPRLFRGVKACPPGRNYFGATGQGVPGNFTFMNNRGPILLSGVADIQLQGLAQGTGSIYISELFATVATTHGLRQEIIGQNPIRFAGD